MIDRSRVRLAWWVPYAPQITIPFGMLLQLAFWHDDSSWVGTCFVLAIWIVLLVGHYLERRRVLRHFWGLLREDAEEIWRRDGWETERALAAYVCWYNRRYYHTPVVELRPR